MDAGWPAQAARVPRGLSPERAWRWCLLRTLRDVRLAAYRGRSISRPNAERMLCRRWRRMVGRCEPAIGQEDSIAWRRIWASWICRFE